MTVALTVAALSWTLGPLMQGMGGDSKRLLVIGGNGFVSISRCPPLLLRHPPSPKPSGRPLLLQPHPPPRASCCAVQHPQS